MPVYFREISVIHNLILSGSFDIKGKAGELHKLACVFSRICEDEKRFGGVFRL